MCISADYHGYTEQDHLDIKAFFIRFTGFTTRKDLPDSATLIYLPRFHGTDLEVDGSKILPESQAFVSLFRFVNAKTKDGEAIYGSRERVQMAEGVRFEIYMTEEKVLKGVFRKDGEKEWKLECKCEMEGEIDVAAAQVCVVVEGQVAMSESVEMVRRRRMMMRVRRRRVDLLEDIPEEREEFDGECCCEARRSDGEEVDEGCEMEMEGMKWAVDVGILVMCLGVGYLVSKASAKTFRRRRIFF